MKQTVYIASPESQQIHVWNLNHEGALTLTQVVDVPGGDRWKYASDYPAAQTLRQRSVRHRPGQYDTPGRETQGEHQHRDNVCPG